jgi:hypothetical protein
MGVRFACHHCGKTLNIKTELAGRRGVCPSCDGKFRIPLVDSDQSLPVEIKQESGTEQPTNASKEQVHHNVDDQLESQVAGHAEATPSEQAPVDNRATVIGSKVLAPSPQLVSKILSEFEATSSWYVRPPNGGQYGPANTEIFGEWITEGRVAASSLVWRDGWPQWRTATEAFPELTKHLPGSSEQATVAKERINPTRETSADASTQTNPLVSGEHHFGEQNRGRSTRRAVSLVALAAVAILLIGALVFITNR